MREFLGNIIIADFVAKDSSEDVVEGSEEDFIILGLSTSPGDMSELVGRSSSQEEEFSEFSKINSFILVVVNDSSEELPGFIDINFSVVGHLDNHGEFILVDIAILVLINPLEHLSNESGHV